MARPRTTLAKLPPDWKADMIAAGKAGASAIEIRVRLGIGRVAWDTLKADSKEFSTAVKEAHDACAVWWEMLGRKLALSGGGNSAVYIFNMKNRFLWRDRPDAEDDDSEPTPVRIVVSVVDGRLET